MSLFRSLAARVVSRFQSVEAVGPDDARSVPDGTVVRVTGTIRADGPARDPAFGVEAACPLLVREVEMRQYNERRLGSGGDREYRYELVWSAKRRQGMSARGRTRYKNPDFPADLRTERFIAGAARLGAWRLHPETMRRLTAGVSVEEPDVIERHFGGRVFTLSNDGWYADGAGHGALRLRHTAGPEGPVTLTATAKDGWLMPRATLGVVHLDVEEA